MTAFGSSMPFQGWGQTEEHEWYFRFRYDSAYLEVRRYLPEDALDPENFPYGFETLLAASRHNVTGHPYRGDLTLMAAQSLFRSLWAQLAPPAPGTTHLEILGAQVDALTAYYDTKPEPAIFVA
jgi:hypothetical protein